MEWLVKTISEAKEKEKSTKTRRSRPPRTYQRGSGGRKRSRTGGILSRTLGRIGERLANRKTAGSKARKKSKRCGKDCQRKIRMGLAGFNK